MATLRGSKAYKNLSIGYCQTLLMKAGCIHIGCNVKNRLLGPVSSSQSERYSSKWLFWLVYGDA